MSKKVKIINLLIFLTWAALISILLYKNYSGIPLEKTQMFQQSFGKDTYWYDIYAGDKKIGFASTTFDRVGDEIIIKHTREIKVVKNQQETLLIENLKSLCDSNYTIKTFEYTSNFKGEEGIKASGEVDGDEIIVFLESPEKRKTHKISTGGDDFYLPMTLIPVIQQKSPAPKTSFLVPVLDPRLLSINDVRVVLEEIRPLKVGINILNLYKFRVGDTIIWANEKGIIIKEGLASGMTLYSQVEEIASDPSDRTLFDYTSLPFFESNKIILDNDKKNIFETEIKNLLKLKVKGFSLDPQLYENSLVTLENNILTIRKKDAEFMKENSYSLPYKNDELSAYLKADRWVMSEHKTVLGNALKMAAVEKNDAFRMARYLTSNLYFTVRSAPMFTLSDSMDIIKTHSGDYLERTVIFASFARAAGLPTRLIGGIVYKDGFLYYHTWPEVWFDKWVPVDPSLAQFPADVTHIPLKQGTLTDIISIIDKLQDIKIEILEAS